MTANYATKRVARSYAREHSVTYREALNVIRGRKADGDNGIERLARQVLIEAIEGCGIGHWAHVEAWNGTDTAVITDLGGERYRLSADTLRYGLMAYLDDHPDTDSAEVDSYVADDIVQDALFGDVIYRFETRRRTVTCHA